MRVPGGAQRSSFSGPYDRTDTCSGPKSSTSILTTSPSLMLHSPRWWVPHDTMSPGSNWMYCVSQATSCRAARRGDARPPTGGAASGRHVRDSELDRGRRGDGRQKDGRIRLRALLPFTRRHRVRNGFRVLGVDSVTKNGAGVFTAPFLIQGVSSIFLFSIAPATAIQFRISDVPA